MIGEKGSDVMLFYKDMIQKLLKVYTVSFWSHLFSYPIYSYCHSISVFPYFRPPSISVLSLVLTLLFSYSVPISLPLQFSYPVYVYPQPSFSILTISVFSCPVHSRILSIDHCIHRFPLVPPISVLLTHHTAPPCPVPPRPWSPHTWASP